MTWKEKVFLSIFGFEWLYINNNIYYYKKYLQNFWDQNFCSRQHFSACMYTLYHHIYITTLFHHHILRWAFATVDWEWVFSYYQSTDHKVGGVYLMQKWILKNKILSTFHQNFVDIIIIHCFIHNLHHHHHFKKERPFIVLYYHTSKHLKKLLAY